MPGAKLSVPPARRLRAALPVWTISLSLLGHEPPFVSRASRNLFNNHHATAVRTKNVNNIWVGWGEEVEDVEHLQHILDLSTCCIPAVRCMERFCANKNLIFASKVFYTNKNLIKLDSFWHVSWCCMNSHGKTNRIKVKIKIIKRFRN